MFIPPVSRLFQLQTGLVGVSLEKDDEREERDVLCKTKPGDFDFN